MIIQLILQINHDSSEVFSGNATNLVQWSLFTGLAENYCCLHLALIMQCNIQNTREVLVSVVDSLIKWWDIIISMQTAILSWERQCVQYSCASGKFLRFTASLLFFLLPILADHSWLCSFILNNDKKVEQNWVASCGFCFPDEQGRVISEARKSSSCEIFFF